MKRVLIPGVILCGADVAQAVDHVGHRHEGRDDGLCSCPCTRKRQHALHQ